MKIIHVDLMVRDMARALSFWLDGIGGRIVEETVLAGEAAKFIVGSEEARAVSRALASVRRSTWTCRFPASRFHQVARSARSDRRNLSNKVGKPHFAVQLLSRQRLPSPAPPPLIAVRPQPPHNPAVQLVEEPSHVSLLVVVAPSHNDRVDFLYQLRRYQRYTSAGQTPDLVLKSVYRFLPWVRVQRAVSGPAPDLAFGQPQLLASPLDLVPQKLGLVSRIYG